MPTTARPEHLTFWSKYTPLNTDSGYAAIDVFDADEELIGSGAVAIGATGGQYVPFSVPVSYTDSVDAAYMSVTFSMAVPGGAATMGTRFLVDDVLVEYGVNGLAGQDGTSAQQVELYPNPASDQVRVRTRDGARITAARVLGTHAAQTLAGGSNGEVLRVDHLLPGVYIVELVTDEGVVRSPLVVTR